MGRHIETDRLVLRPWDEADADALFRYAKDPAVGPIAGWAPHASVEDSRQVIRGVFSAPETFAVVLKDLGEPVGCVGLLFGENGTLPLPPGEAELGYWIGRPFWGRGLIPEASRAVIRHAFADLGISTLWCISDAENAQSRRVMEKCGFAFHHIEENVPCPLMGGDRHQYCAILPKGRWQDDE